MFARSFSIVLPAAFCLTSAIGTDAQSNHPIGWPANGDPSPSTITVIDPQPRPQPPAIMYELSRSDRKLIEPDEADEIRFHSLLEGDDYSIIKLLHVNCGGDDPKVVRAGGCRDTIPGHGADFSFRTGKHSFPGVADLKLRDNAFVAGSVMTQGLLIFVGQVGIDTLDLSSAAVKLAAEFVPATDRRGAEQQASEINKGIIKNKLLLSSTAYVREGRTYVLRSIAYRTKNDGRDRRRDVIIAFTVVRQDADGNVTLIWKRLKEKDSPKLSFEE